jgi:hypothetical protein
VGLIMVIAAGFALSFDAVSAVGRAARLRSSWAWLLPAAVDGAMTIATVTVVVMRRLDRPTTYPWTVVVVNSAVSLVCNGLHAQLGEAVRLPGPLAVAVSAVPAMNLALSVHLLVVLLDALAVPGPQDPGVAGGSPPPADESCVAKAKAATNGGYALQRQAWTWALTQRTHDGDLPTGDMVGDTFGRSARWGRQVLLDGKDGRLGPP